MIAVPPKNMGHHVELLIYSNPIPSALQKHTISHHRFILQVKSQQTLSKEF